MAIKVLQLGSPTGLYGAERWILALVRNLDSQKVHSVVAAIKDDPDLEVPLCIKAAELGFETKIFTAYGKFNLEAVRQLRHYVILNKINFLHTHGYKQDLIGLLATRGTSCKIISTPHGWSRDAGFKIQCYEALDRIIFPFLDAVVPLSDELYDNLKRVPFLKLKLKLILNGVDIDEIEACKTVAPELIEWKNQGYFIIGYIGRLIHLKGIDILLKAAARLKSEIKWKIAIVGDGEQKGYLKRLTCDLNISDKVYFFGFRNNRLEFLNGFDVFVLPSRLEGIPRCLMEAMAAYIPVISSDIAGCRVIVDYGKTGYLFKKENDENLAYHVNYIFSHKNEMEQSTSAAAELIRKRHSAKRMAIQYQHLYFESHAVL